jgi:4-diphosphocytidyl-2-C-methyl-D-erythritol kinase
MRREAAIDEVLKLLRGQEETLIARLSGSGATCFSLCPDQAAARRLSARLQRLRPEWWVQACRLGDESNRRGAYSADPA